MNKKIQKLMAVLLCGSMLVSANGLNTLAQDETDRTSYVCGKEYTDGEFYYEYLLNNEGICIRGYRGEKKELTIPEEINNRKVRGVVIWHNNKFSKTVKKVHLPETGQITDVSFEGCEELESVNIPEGVESMSFMDCISLKSINIPSSVKLIGQEAFYKSGIKQITMHEGIEHIGNEAFRHCMSLKEVIIPSTVYSIGKLAFAESGLKKVTVKGSKIIEGGAFAYCKSLEDIQLPSGVKSLRDDPFEGCPKLKKITIPKSVVYMKTYPEDNHTKINFESPYIKKYVGSQKGSDGKKYYYNVYIKGVEIQVKGKYCYKETQDILKEINKKRKAKKWREVKLSYRGLNASMERALYLSIADCDMHERPNKTRYKYDLPSDNYIEGTVNGEVNTREQFIKDVMADTGFKNIKTIGIGCVKIGRKKYYFAVAQGRKEDKTVTKTYNDKAFMKDKAVRGDYIKKIAGKDITLKRGQTTSLNIKAKLTEKYPYNMKKYSAGKITANNLKIENMNTNIIRTDSKGNITGVKRGTAKVKVYLKMNKKCYTEFNVEVV